LKLREKGILKLLRCIDFPSTEFYKVQKPLYKVVYISTI